MEENQPLRYAAKIPGGLSSVKVQDASQKNWITPVKETNVGVVGFIWSLKDTN